MSLKAFGSTYMTCPSPCPGHDLTHTMKAAGRAHGTEDTVGEWAAPWCKTRLSLPLPTTPVDT